MVCDYIFEDEIVVGFECQMADLYLFFGACLFFLVALFFLTAIKN